MPTSRLILVKLSALGDLVHALPLAEALRQGLGPDATIGWAVRGRLASMLDGCPFIDQVHVLGDEGAWHFAGSLRARGYDTAVDAQGLFVSGLVAWRSGARRRLGFDANREGNRIFLTEPVVAYKKRAHMVERLLEFGAALGLPRQPVQPQTWLARRGADDAAVLLPDSDRPWVGCIIGASTPDKMWPAERWSALAQTLAREGARVAVIGGSGEATLARKIAADAPGAIAADLTGKTKLESLGAVFARCGAVVGGDSGPTHLAVAVGTPVVGLYGVTDPARTGTCWGAGPSIVLDFAERDSPPELRRPRHSTLPDALSRISADAAFAAVSELLR